MKRRLGIYASAGALLLLSYFPVGIASSDLADVIGDVAAPKQDHVLIGIPCILAGWGFIGAVVVGMIFRNLLACRIAAVAFLGDMAVVIHMHLRAGDYQSWSDRAVGLGVAGLCLAAAIYVWGFSWKPPELPSPTNSRPT